MQAEANNTDNNPTPDAGAVEEPTEQVPELSVPDAGDKGKVRSRVRAVFVEPASDMGDFAFGERIINYIRWGLLGILFMFNNTGFTENRDLIWPINGMILLAVLITGYTQIRLHQGHSFGKGVTLILAAIQDSLITIGVYLTGMYHSHFFIFYYPSLLGFSLAFSPRTSLVYTTIVAVVYIAMSWFLTPELGSASVALRALVERVMVMYIIVIIGCFLVRQERDRRQRAVAAERQLSEKNEQLALTLNTQMENWRLIVRANDQTSEQLCTLAEDLAQLADELGAGSEGISIATQEITGRAMTYVDQVTSIGQVTKHIVSAANDLSASAGPTGIASEQAQRAVAQASEIVGALNQRSQAIGDLASAVRRVADQTNLLAFNAAIEAIHSGQEGQRFAVVAGEVRHVAEQAISLSREIDELSNDVQQGARQVLNAMDEIASMVDQTVGLVQVTSETSQNQQSSAEVMARSVDTLKTVSQQNAADIKAVANTVQQQRALLNRIAALGQELSDSAGDLGSLTQTIVR